VVGVAQASLEHAQWQLDQTAVKSPVDGWVTNLTTRVGDYASAGHPVFALVDSNSFYVIGYFEETKLRHIRAGDPAQIVLYSSKQTLQGHVSSIGRAIVDQSIEGGNSLVANIKPNIPWVRLAQRVPVRIELNVCLRIRRWFPGPPAPSQLANPDETAGPVMACSSLG
jgi:multidrug resistance efflux pump